MSAVARLKAALGLRGAGAVIVAELGLNHGGSLATALRLVDAAQAAGADAVKLQRGVPEDWIPAANQNAPREIRGGVLPYKHYRRALEFSGEDMRAFAQHCRFVGMPWFASALDVASVEYLEGLGVPCHKLASCQLTNHELLRAMLRTEKPCVISTGMSTNMEVMDAVRVIANENADDRCILLHCCSAYPCPPEAINLRCMDNLRKYGLPVGYSGHEIGYQVSLAAVARGACLVEKHFTLSRASPGADHAASLEPEGLRRLCRDVRVIETALGDGIKAVHPSEESARKKLRGA